MSQKNCFRFSKLATETKFVILLVLTVKTEERIKINYVSLEQIKKSFAYFLIEEKKITNFYSQILCLVIAI